MSKENIKKENNSEEAPPCTPGIEIIEESIKELLPICPECSSPIEIVAINDNNNTIEYRCLKDKKQYIMAIKQYFDKLENNKKIGINEVNDKCKNHKKENYVCYCFDCNCHLCNECLKTREHIGHKKSNIIEIKPIKEELNIVEKVIEDYELRLEKIRIEKFNREKENEELSNKEKKIEKEKLNKEIKKNKKKEEKELEINNNNYLNDIEEIKREYENKIKLRKMKYEEENQKIFNKYKFINEKDKMKYKVKIEEIANKYKNEFNKYNYEEKIDNFTNILKINQITLNLYNSYKNNYYNSININNLLMYYIKSEHINNEIMKKKLKDKYKEIVDIVDKKNKEGKKVIKDKKEENEKEEKYKNEINGLRKKISNNIYIIIGYRL